MLNWSVAFWIFDWFRWIKCSAFCLGVCVCVAKFILPIIISHGTPQDEIAKKKLCTGYLVCLFVNKKRCECVRVCACVCECLFSCKDRVYLFAHSKIQNFCYDICTRALSWAYVRVRMCLCVYVRCIRHTIKCLYCCTFMNVERVSLLHHYYYCYYHYCYSVSLLFFFSSLY